MQNADIRRFYIRTITEYGKDKNWEINKIEAKKAEKEAKLKAIEEEKERKRIEKELLNQPEQLTQITLERLQEKRKGKKSKNIIDKIMYVKTEQLNEFIDLVNDEDKLLVNEFTILKLKLRNYLANFAAL